MRIKKNGEIPKPWRAEKRATATLTTVVVKVASFPDWGRVAKRLKARRLAK
jgi:hypothetical protein